MYLLDTNALIGMLFHPSLLSERAKEILEGDESLYVSVASLWEISIKKSIGKLDIDSNSAKIADACAKNDVEIIQITPAQLDRLENLPFIHKDPFDRLLIAQAMDMGYTILTRDAVIPKYDVNTSW